MILELFGEYIPFIIILITLTLNVLLIIFKSPWWIYIVANVILVILLGFIGEKPFDLIGEVTTVIVDLIGNIIRKVFSTIFDILFGWLSGCSTGQRSGFGDGVIGYVTEGR